MSLKTYAAALLAALVVTAGAAGAVAAAPGNSDAAAPADAGPDEQTGDQAAEQPDNATDTEATGDAPAAAAAGDGAAEQRGPPADMPEQVPGHVEQIHDLIGQFLNGELSDLGSAISDVTPDDESDEGDASQQGEEPTATPTPDGSTA